MDNFFFFRPEAMSVHRELGIMKFDEGDNTYLKWKKLQHYLFYNYDIPESNNGKFNFTAYGSPIYGVVDGVLMLIPFPDDDRVKPELLDYFKDIWSRMNNGIEGYSIDELYDKFDLSNYDGDESNYKEDGQIIVYKHAHTFYKNWLTK
jgi:hypothetical protein